MVFRGGKNDAGVVGGKGSNLGECAQAGMNVPPGFCITAGAFRLHMASCEIDLGLRDGQTNKDIAACILQQEIAATTSKEIIKAYKKLGSPMVAVRSSATAEDLQKCIICRATRNVPGYHGARGNCYCAIKECWASLFSERVASYSMENADTSDILGKIACCVVVQEMVDADAAGVAFTANPMTQDRDEFVITSNFGLGESVVSDMVTPDTFTDRHGNIKSKQISENKKW